jgi:hypothetical protein
MSSLLLSLLLLALLVAVVSASNAAGRAFLKANAQNEGVVVLPSGLQYKVLSSGNGQGHPRVSTPCQCQYVGKLITGEEFDSGTHTFAPNQVIRGWTEVRAVQECLLCVRACGRHIFLTTGFCFLFFIFFKKPVRSPSGFLFLWGLH